MNYIYDSNNYRFSYHLIKQVKMKKKIRLVFMHINNLRVMAIHPSINRNKNS
jgi:hypothetical protein